MSTSRDFDQFCKTVSNLSFRECAEKREVEEGVDGCVISAQSILVVAIVNGHFDRDRSVNQADDSRWNTDEVRVPPICRTCEPMSSRLVYCQPCDEAERSLGSECLEVIFGNGKLLPSNVGH